MFFYTAFHLVKADDNFKSQNEETSLEYRTMWMKSDFPKVQWNKNDSLLGSMHLIGKIAYVPMCTPYIYGGTNL